MIPEQWQDLFQTIALLVSWIPGMQKAMFETLFLRPTGVVALLSYVLLFFPVMLWFGAIWCNQITLYTLPLRSGRITLLKTMLMAWWDAAVSIWLYWVGLGRLIVVIMGWFFTMARLAVRLVAEAFRQLIILPITMTGQVTQTYFRPGFPWIALSMLIFWCLLEAVIFTFTLYPTVSEMMGSIAGGAAPGLTRIFLFLFLFLLIMGSFACVEVLSQSVRNRQYKYLVQMVLVEIFVMIFEVMFLYRELVDAITPWIAAQTGGRLQLGIWFTLSLGTFGWIGIRGMTWFLFGQYGTPPLLSIISRRPVGLEAESSGKGEKGDKKGAPAKGAIKLQTWWHTPIDDFRKELGWLHAKATELLEYFTLPIIHVIASVLNFAMILVASRPVFDIPFKNLQEVFQTRHKFSELIMLQKKASS